MKKGIFYIGLFLLLSLSCRLTYAQLAMHIGLVKRDGYTGNNVYKELLKKIYAGQSIHFKIQSINQSISNFNIQKLDIIVGVYQHELNEAFFPQWYVGTNYPIVAFYDKKNIRIQHASDIIPLRQVWVVDNNFTGYLPTQQKGQTVASIKAGFDALINKQTDVFVDYYDPSIQKLRKTLSFVKVLPSQHIYVAFHHNQFGRKLAKIFDEKMSIMREKGMLSQLYGNTYQFSELATFAKNKKIQIIYTNSVSLLRHVTPTKNAINDSQNLRLILNRMNNYKIIFKPFNDIDEMYKHRDQDNVCFTELIDTSQRAKQFSVSKPISIFLGLRLYSTLPLSVKTPINLERLFQHRHQLTLGTVSGRSYGRKLDKILTKINEYQLIISPVNIFTLFKQLKNNRFNSLIEYPSIKLLNWNKINSERLYSYKVVGAKPYVLAHMMCSKSDNGGQFIQDFNKLLDSLYHSVYFFNIQYQRVPFGNKKKFIRDFNQMFDKY